MKQILLVEDEQKIADFVINGLQAEGFEVTHVLDGQTGIDCALSNPFDLILLDVMLPEKSGIEVLQAIRVANSLTPIIMLTAKSELEDKLRGFNHGANDYLPKPFFVEELIVRCKSQLNIRINASLTSVTVGELILDKIARQVTWRGRIMVLSQREFMLLEYLMRSPGNVFTRAQIMQFVWGIDFDTQTNTVDVCIQRIRRKLINTEKFSLKEFPIESIRGVGYRVRKANDF